MKKYQLFCMKLKKINIYIEWQFNRYACFSEHFIELEEELPQLTN